MDDIIEYSLTEIDKGIPFDYKIPERIEHYEKCIKFYQESNRGLSVEERGGIIVCLAAKILRLERRINEY